MESHNYMENLHDATTQTDGMKTLHMILINSVGQPSISYSWAMSTEFAKQVLVLMVS